MEQAKAVTREFEAQYPECENVLVGRAIPADGNGMVAIPIVSADCRRLPRRTENARITEWLKVRTGSPEVRLVLTARRQSR